MNELNKQFKPSTAWAKIASFILVFPFALFFLHFLASYWTYFDYGVNAAANSLALILYAPIVFFIFIIAALIGSFGAARLRLNGLSTLLLNVSALVISFIALFGLEVWQMRDYPNPNNANVYLFLTDYLTKLF